MFAHQKCDELGVLRSDAVLTAKAFNFEHAQFGMVTAPAFGNVMEQSGRVKDERLVPTGCQLRAKGVFVGVIGNEETPNVSKDHQDVLVNCVNMKQVMLHLTHNVSKYPQVTSKH